MQRRSRARPRWLAALGVLAAVAATAAATQATHGALASDSPLNPVGRALSVEDCDLTAAAGVCLFNGRKVLLPDAVPKGLVAHYTFDEIKVADASGNQNHAANPIPPGPGVGGKGASAMFNGFNHVSVPHSDSFSSPVYSVSLWVFLRRLPAGAETSPARQCPLVHKGQDGNHRAPSVEVNTRTRQLRVTVSTDSDKFADGEFVLSNARLPLQRWTHVVAVRRQRDVLLYVNGVLDARNATEGMTVTNTGPLFLGGTPWLRDQCTVETYVDEVRVYAREVTADEVEAEAAPALGGVEPSFLHFGCSQCSLEEAARSCREGYHLCTVMELHTGGYQVARMLGYASRTTHVWSHAALVADPSDPAHLANKGKMTGLGLCCTDQR